MKRLVLIGGGHAHVHVLDACARQPFPESDITLISPYPRQIYSGMLPGWIAGHYSIEQCAIPIDLLARRAGIRFVQTACTDIDLESKQVRCANGQLIPFDLVSIDSGPTVNLDHTPGASLHALPNGPTCCSAPASRPQAFGRPSSAMALRVRNWPLPSRIDSLVKNSRMHASP